MHTQLQNTELLLLVDKASSGEQEALETLVTEIQDLVFNLSLRMLGMISDAEDATQEILIKIITNLSSFRKESAFTTWVYRLAVNYLINYKKSMFAKHPLDFDYYGNDIQYGQVDQVEFFLDTAAQEVFAEELKLSCTNVMLQCLDAESRGIFILGTMFRMDSQIAAEIFEITPENYRQRLSRIRKKMAAFLTTYCGLTESGFCDCKRRIAYAISQKRINPEKLEFRSLQELDTTLVQTCKDEMEKLDALAMTFEQFPKYQSPITARGLMETILKSGSLQKIQKL